MFKDITDYLNIVKLCEDELLLQKEFRISDNWIALLYGVDEKIHSGLTDIFLNSLIISGSRWTRVDRLCDNQEELLVNDQHTVEVQIVKCKYGIYDNDENKVNGLDHIGYVMFHPKLMSKQEDLKPTIVSFLEYLIETKFTFRLPQPKLGLDYIAN